MKFNLPDSILSLQDLTSVQLELKEYARWFAHESMKQRVSSSAHAAAHPILTPAATELLNQWQAKKRLDQTILDDLLTTLETYKKTATTISITLAAPPTSDIKKTLVSWCRHNISPNILVSFQFNATILGGMVIRYGSRVFDWSFKRQLLAARGTFPEVLRRV
jgi:F0F1-type ATP synthase delta subunit